MEGVIDFEKSVAIPGDRLTNKYLSSLDEKTVKEYTEKANKLIDELVKDLDDKIDKKMPPIASKSSIKSSLGIVANDYEFERLLKDYAFFFILKRIAKEKKLVADVTQQGMMDPSKPGQPIIGLQLALTLE